MIIYMLLNEATEKVYIGQTKKTLDERWAGHVRASMEGGTLAVDKEIFVWGPDVWTRVVLQHCNSQEEMDLAEGKWIEYCSAREPNVGYNVKRMRTPVDTLLKWYALVRLGVSLDRVMDEDVDRTYESMKNTLARRKKSQNKRQMTREQYVELGVLGAAKARSMGHCRRRDEMTPEEIEQYREWGRKGTKRKEDMTEEERERFREWGRKGARRAKGLE